MARFNINPTTWTAIGTGPLRVQPDANIPVFVSFSSTAPALGDPAFTVTSGGADLNISGNAWAMSKSNFNTTVEATATSSASGGTVNTVQPPITYSAAAGSPFTLTSAWQKVATTTSATAGLRLAPVTTAAAYDIEWCAVAAGAAAPTLTFGEPIQGGEDFAAGLPIGDIYLKSASGQIATVKIGA